jgi:endonuclease/exonuclease/phosphatase family metal-dependent hydrolase
MLRIATWNVEWARPSTERGRRVASVISELDADIIVMTEGCAALLPSSGYLMDGGSNWGYGLETDRRKVLAWSKTPWSHVHGEDHGAARGRVVRATTATPDGPISVTAVCIPWSGAHVRSGRRDAVMWDEHIECCRLLATTAPSERSIMLGDFNQRIPRRRQPHRAFAALALALEPWDVPTAGTTSQGQLIDHIAISRDLAATDIRTWAGSDDAGPLSDHSGVTCSVQPQS